MKILVIGNIGAGKTTLGRKLSKLTNFPLIEIDKLRERYLHGNVSDEYLCLHYFLREAESDRSVILEFTGVGCHKYGVKRALELSKHRILVVICRTSDISIILERLKSKSYHYRSPFGTNIYEHVFFIEKELINDINNGFWERENFFVIKVLMDKLADIEKNVLTIKNLLTQLLEK